MSFSETIFLFFLALIVFGPKKLPEIARQAGKLLAELRRASNEFRSQIETEIAHLEVEKKQEVLPPSAPPRGVVSSLSLNAAASGAAEQKSRATVAASSDAASPTADSAVPSSGALSAGSLSSESLSDESVSGKSLSGKSVSSESLSGAPVTAAEPVADPASAPATQDSHV